MLQDAYQNITCTHQDLLYPDYNNTFLCNTGAKEVCLDSFDLYNFYEVYFCQLDNKFIFFLPLFCLAVFLIFKYTSIAVDEYIAEGIQRISNALGLSESLAAVTLLALANGAGDVITALVASGAEGGVSYNIGALYGAGLFVCSFVVALCIFKSEKPIVFDPMIIFRDIGVYIVSTLATLGFALYGEITVWSSLILLALYVVLVLIVVIEMLYKKNQ